MGEEIAISCRNRSDEREKKGQKKTKRAEVEVKLKTARRRSGR